MNQTDISYQVKPVRNAIAMLTNQCNLGCVYCYQQRRPERMSMDTAKEIIHFLHRSGVAVPGFTFFGGEPMMEFDTIIHPLVEWSKEDPSTATKFAMTTNGTLFTEDRLRFLKENNINFMLSMDGGQTAQLGNRPLRNGGNSFDTVMQYVPQILELWPMQSFRSTLTPENAGHVFDDILFFEQIGCRNLMMLPDLFQPWPEEAVATLQAQMRQYEQYLLDRFRAGEQPLVLHELFVAFRSISLLIQRKEMPRRSNPHCESCRQCGLGVRGGVSVDPNGDFYGCHHISPLTRDSIFYIGNVYDGVDEARVRALVDAYNPQKSGGSACASCGLDAICDGGCIPNNYQINGDFHVTPEMYCIWKRMVTDMGHRMLHALEGNAPFCQVLATGLKRGW